MKKVKRVLRQTWVRVRLYRVRYLRWWHRNDKKYTWRWRVANGAVALLLLVTIVMPVVQSVWERNRYTLSAEALQLTGHTEPSLAKQLTYDADKQLYQFNKEAVSTGNGQGLPAEIQKASVGASDKSNTKSYSLDIPKDFTQGVTYHDTNSQLSFKLVPQFKALPGKTDQGHLVFPIEGNSQAVYTLKNNGLKEDIIVPEVTESTMRFDYTLELPKTMEVRAIPDSGGAIGIYAADPSLFGDIQYGSDKDRQAVEKARINANKTYLVFGLPAPVVKDTDGKEAGSARFELNGNRLSVVAEGLKASSGPITIDPSVVVTSTSDFQTQGNNEGMIDFGTSGQITRGGLTGGTLAAWGSATGLSYQFEHARSVVYNNYLYLVGGTKRSPSTNYNTVSYVAINSDGTLGTWNTTTSMPYVWNDGGLVAYNGYMYAVAGLINTGGGAANSADIYYAPINSNGTVGTWNTTSALPIALRSNTAAVYGGYLYALSGTTGSNDTNANANVYYAPINANGTVGTWNTTTSLTFARNHSEAVAYNGYMYILGGATTTPTYTNVVQYAKINSDGTLGSWNGASSFTTARYGMFVGFYNGYMYLTGGTNGTARTDTQYAQINANGSLGTWLGSPNNLPNAKIYPAGAIYNGYVYVAGGYDNSVNYSDVQYAAIDRAGKPVAFGTLSNNFTTARALSCSVAYNGYLYAIGGSTSDDGNTNVTTVRYTALDSTTGNSGSWNTTTALPVARGSAGCTAHNGYLYVADGYTGTSSGSQVNTIIYNSISSNGTLGASWTTSANSDPGGSAGGKPGLFTYGTSSGTYLYILGGCVGGGNGTCPLTRYASLNVSTGAIGSFTTSGNDMINSYAYRAYAQVGKYLYAFGGHNGTNTAYSAAEYTSINNDGSINAWASTTSMNTAIGFTNGTTVNGCIYSVGGENSALTSLNTVQYACPAANGTISAWYNAPNLTVATTDMGVTSYNGYIYGVGGYTTSVQNTTQYAYVNHGGSGDTMGWSLSASGLTADRVNATSTAYNGYAYVIGGVNASTEQNTVQYTQFSNTGDLGTFTNDAHTLGTARTNAGSVAYNGYLYVVGGETQGGGTRYGSVEYAPIGSSGSLSGNFATTTSFVTGTGGDTGRESPCVVAYKGYIYAVGGWDGTTDHADTRYAAINSNGTLGSWSDSGNNFTNGRSDGGCFVANGYLYIVGGDGASTYNDVQSVPINSNGTLGTWSYTASLPGIHKKASVGYSNGFAYVTGGCKQSGCSTGYGDTMYAPVYPGGALGVWQVSANKLPSGYTPYETTGFAYNGAMYVFGGNGGISGSGTYYSPLSIISRTARYSKLVDLGNPVSVSSITYNGTLPTSVATAGITPIYFRAAGSDKVFGSVTASGAITAGSTACLATSQNYVRYLEVTILLDGSGGQAILPDAAGTYANVTDFTVNYITPHPAPNIRLRHGQTLQTGNLSPLDTCYP